MISPFDTKHIDRIIIALSTIPSLVLVYLGEVGILLPCISWLASGLFARMIFNIIKGNHLGLEGRNHSIAISWSLLAIFTNFALVHNNQSEAIVAVLSQMTGVLFILSIMLKAWQIKIAPVHFIVCGIIVGILSVFFLHCVFWLLLFPAIFFHMRSWSNQNCGSLFTGFFITIWLAYVFRLFVFGESDADNFIFSYSSLYTDLLAIPAHYSLGEWAMIAVATLFIIIYSIFSYTLNVSKTVKAEVSMYLFAAHSLIFLLFVVLDSSHLYDYLGILFILLSLQLSVLLSCIINPKNDLWTLIVILIFALLFIFSLLQTLFL